MCGSVTGRHYGVEEDGGLMNIINVVAGDETMKFDGFVNCSINYIKWHQFINTFKPSFSASVRHVKIIWASYNLDVDIVLFLIMNVLDVVLTVLSVPSEVSNIVQFTVAEKLLLPLWARQMIQELRQEMSESKERHWVNKIIWEVSCKLVLG